MRIIFKVSGLKCFFAYKRTTQQEVSDELDEKLIELASRLSGLISSGPSIISTIKNAENNDFVPKEFQTYITINLIFRCFDKNLGGKIIREETIPISLCFDTIIDKEFIDKIFNETLYVNLEPDTCRLLDTLVRG